MTVSLVQPSKVPFMPPSRAPRGSILDYATIIEDVSFVDTKGLVWSYNCIGVDVDEVACSTFKSLTKRFDPPSNTDGAQFVVQGGVTCKPFGFSGDDPALKAAFDAVEGEGVSIGIHDALFDTAVDLTPAVTSLPPVTALGLLEAYGYSNYAGQPIIHIGPSIVGQLAANRTVEATNGQLHTTLGTPVAVSSGNETKTGGKLDADQWAFVTGAVVLHRSQAVLLNEINRSTNDITVLYERLYVAGIDCLIGKVKVKVF
jgi:hypothetical protein